MLLSQSLEVSLQRLSTHARRHILLDEGEFACLQLNLKHLIVGDLEHNFMAPRSR
ncbi:hypothetical protein D3C79_1098440 [compost metagenome]